ncbi:hypothetical protein LAG90_07590 [Marinilongibacter aquaticus]|uniref:hypothetical protein n=1 Tax=Marinilongibacter aquaticus TaxID=2975157 RepID=UPI0021BD6DA8|nr:hypothetical protein [Marinilongibacter aquaticus]UBM60502.1 hypothetical protein LAG90_07590 [Marinilongibacter aquaticus]
MLDKLSTDGFEKKKNAVREDRPYHFLHELEPNTNGQMRKVNTLFLTGKECVFHCLMCDLWKNTLDSPTPIGALVEQIDYALAQLPEAEAIKLYNSSNFFDVTAVPLADYPAIATRLQKYERVIVENHPRLCGQHCIDFDKLFPGKLEVAMGLESIHPEVMSKLNKQMSLEDFEKATKFLRQHDIDVRAFVLLNPPYLTDREENIYWAIKAVEFAFACGVNFCTLIPTRTGNGIMEELEKQGLYQAPELSTLEDTLEACLSLNKGFVFADTWDLEKFTTCSACLEPRRARIEQMNLSQTVLPKITCNCQSESD